jgi:hypothetical protein
LHWAGSKEQTCAKPDLDEHVVWQDGAEHTAYLGSPYAFEHAVEYRSSLSFSSASRACLVTRACFSSGAKKWANRIIAVQCRILLSSEDYQSLAHVLVDMDCF